MTTTRAVEIVFEERDQPFVENELLNLRENNEESI